MDAQLSVLANLLEGLEAVFLGKQDVEKDQFRFELSNPVDGGRSVPCTGDLVARRAQGVGQDPDVSVIVVNQENLGCHSLQIVHSSMGNT